MVEGCREFCKPPDRGCDSWIAPAPAVGRLQRRFPEILGGDAAWGILANPTAGSHCLRRAPWIPFAGCDYARAVLILIPWLFSKGMVVVSPELVPVTKLRSGVYDGTASRGTRFVRDPDL
ncbi:hypothetical protein K227x_32290 [Rubripirellula lacrimiformis]|uniref:Uncharacterized protein n=1 Tax=Rubripirellula lacrimiformis TaxID=1930273 RepID=A0A517NCG7_9BACT|nr:hypothetical protein K227x_32290 [Rubripirellula lacrimiformis]